MKSSKLAARITPSFGRNQSVHYLPQKNHRTPTRTPTRRNDRVIPAPEIINQPRFQRSIYRCKDNSTTCDDDLSHEKTKRLNLYGSTAAADSYEDFDQLPSNSEEYFSTAANGLEWSRNWISTSDNNPTNNGDSNDQWPCAIVDTDHPVIFVENRVYVGPDERDEFKCYDLGQQQQQQEREDPLPPYSHSTPKQQRKKTVLFEKVNYEKYRRSQRSYCGDEDSGDHDFSTNKCSVHKHCFSNGEIDRDEYGQKWCQDLLNWSREAAEYQRRHNQQNDWSSSPVDSSSGSNWFQDKFRSSSGSRYNKMSAAEDSGVVCQFEEDVEADDEFWGRTKSNFGANDSDDKRRQGATTTQQKVVAEAGVDSWETLKQRVFEPAEKNITPSRVVRDSEGRLLGRRCSCNSMCTSLCTLETWVDDEVFDNNFNEELERRVGVGYGISRK